MQWMRNNLYKGCFMIDGSNVWLLHWIMQISSQLMQIAQSRVIVLCVVGQYHGGRGHYPGSSRVCRYDTSEIWSIYTGTLYISICALIKPDCFLSGPLSQVAMQCKPWNIWSRKWNKLWKHPNLQVIFLTLWSIHTLSL